MTLPAPALTTTTSHAFQASNASMYYEHLLPALLTGATHSLADHHTLTHTWACKQQASCEQGCAQAQAMLQLPSSMPAPRGPTKTSGGQPAPRRPRCAVHSTWCKRLRRPARLAFPHARQCPWLTRVAPPIPGQGHALLCQSSEGDDSLSGPQQARPAAPGPASQPLAPGRPGRRRQLALRQRPCAHAQARAPGGAPPPPGAAPASP